MSSDSALVHVVCLVARHVIVSALAWSPSARKSIPTLVYAGELSNCGKLIDVMVGGVSQDLVFLAI